MLVIVPGQRASSYNAFLRRGLVTRRTTCSTSQHASCNTRKTHLTLKSFATNGAECSPAQPPRLLLVLMAFFQTEHLQPHAYDRQPYQMLATAAFRLRTRVLQRVCKSPLPSLGTSRRQQRKRCVTFYTSFNSSHANVQRLNAKCDNGPT